MTALAQAASLSLSERRRVLDATWVLTVAFVFASLTGAWFLRVLPVDIDTLGRVLFVYTAGYLGLAMLVHRSGHPGVARATTVLFQACNVLLLAVVWHMAGGLANPVFVLAFVLPIVASGLVLLRWQPYAMAGLASLAVALISLAESEELRWYVARFGLEVEAVAGLVSDMLPARPPLEVSAWGGPTSQFLLVFSFAGFALAVALLSETLSTLLLRLYARLTSTADLLRETQSLFRAVMTAEPEPAVLVYADTGQVLHASESFCQEMGVDPEGLPGKTLFELVSFEAPQQIRTLLMAERGDYEFCAYRVGDSRRIANLRGYATEHAGTRYVYLGFRDQTEVYHLKALFDGLEDPMLALAPDGRLLYSNNGAKKLFPDLRFGMDMLPLLTGPEQEVAAEWRAEDSSERESFLRVGGHPYRAVTVGSSLPGEAEWATILTLHSIAEEERLYKVATRDALTGLYNRRYFEEAVPKLTARAARGGNAALALLDLDYFKQVNDQLGHPVGDRALMLFVEIVSRHLRGTDLFARLGGDEFAVVFADTRAAGGEQVLHRVYADLPGSPLVAGDERRVLSFSSGVASFHQGDTVEQLVQRADQALYAAKEAGRGRCVARD